MRDVGVLGETHYAVELFNDVSVWIRFPKSDEAVCLLLFNCEAHYRRGAIEYNI